MQRCAVDPANGAATDVNRRESAGRVYAATASEWARNAEQCAGVARAVVGGQGG